MTAECALWGLTFELTPRAEAGGVSLVRDDSTTGAGRAYAACRSESGVERGVLRHRAAAAVTLYCAETAKMALGLLLAMANRVRAAPLGCLRPCSQP